MKHIKAITTTKHERTHRINIDRRSLEKIVAMVAADSFIEHMSIPLDTPGTTFKVTFEDELEGSPAYKVGTKATVIITEDLDAQKEALSKECD